MTDASMTIPAEEIEGALRDYIRVSKRDHDYISLPVSFVKTLIASLTDMKAEIERLRDINTTCVVGYFRMSHMCGTRAGKIGIANARIAALEAQLEQAVAHEREECAKVADAYADENIRMAGDTILIDPVLKNGDVSSIAFARSEDLQIQGTIHSAMYHAAVNISAAIRARSEQVGK